MTETFAAYAQRIADGDDSVFLGQLAWYAINDFLSVPQADVVAIMDKLGFDKDCAPCAGTGKVTDGKTCSVCDGSGRDRSVYPNAPRADDVFRRVCTLNQRKRQPTEFANIFENHLIRDVKRERGLVVKQLVVEAVNGNDETLDYTPAVQLTYRPGATKIEVDTLDHVLGDNPTVREIVAAIEADFKVEQGRINGHAMRDTYRRVLLDAKATAVRAGVYFVAQAEAFTVHNLNELAARVKALPEFKDDDELMFHALPLIDDKAQRAMLRKALEDETVEQVLKDLGEIDRILAGPEITNKRAGDYLERMKDVKEKTMQYRDLLDDQLDTIGMQLAVYEARMVDLLNHTKSD